MLNSVEAVVEALGGTAAVAGLAGVGMSAVSNWKTRGTIPAEQFFTFRDALAKREMEADPVIFGFKAPAEPADEVRA